MLCTGIWPRSCTRIRVGVKTAFQELGEAVEYLKRALLLLNQRVQTKTRTEDALARKRAILRANAASQG